MALEQFCTSNHLCRKHCGLEKIKGPCTRYRVRGLPCVCAGSIEVSTYNARFESALVDFSRLQSRHIYKLAGRSTSEDAFIYLLNGIYQGYGYIDKCDVIYNENDVLSRLQAQTNNYDTTRIVSGLLKKEMPISL